MEFSTITNESKTIILESSISSIEVELYRELVQSGIDPNAFSSVEELRESGNPDLIMRIPRISDILSRLAFVKEQLQGL